MSLPLVGTVVSRISFGGKKRGPGKSCLVPRVSLVRRKRGPGNKVASGTERYMHSHYPSLIQ